MRRKAYHNLYDPVDLPPDASADMIKVDFARRLQAKMVEKGLRQIDLARRAEELLPDGSKFGRDSVSLYVRGKHMPGPTYLKAMAEALGCDSKDLLPTRGIPTAQEIAAPPFEMKEIGGGNVYLRINQAVTWSVAASIVSILKG
jgi:transcriptional regulator with XRE-family HTH domain